MPELYILLTFMIVGAIVAVQIRDLLSAVVAVGVVGLALSVAFLILKAPDLAITQLIVEILCLIILIRATVTRDRIETPGGRGVLKGLGAFALAAVILWFAISSLRELPLFGDPLMRVSSWYIEEGAKRGEPLSLVNEILLNYRGYDTVGEATVFFTALVGVLALMRSRGRKKITEDDEDGA
jgi:multisubunit Na+/H+ antiporter MnhB subunit